MNLKEARTEMYDSHILIGNYFGVSIWSMFIKMLAWWKSDITHTSALEKDFFQRNHGEGIVYEAWQKGGANKHKWSDSYHKQGTKVDVMRILCPLWFSDLFYKYLEDTQGKVKYDTLGVVLGFLSKERNEDSSKVFCTEWIGKAQEYANSCRPEGTSPFYLLARVPSYKWAPQLLYVAPFAIHKTLYTP